MGNFLHQFLGIDLIKINFTFELNQLTKINEISKCDLVTGVLKAAKLSEPLKSYVGRFAMDSLEGREFRFQGAIPTIRGNADSYVQSLLDIENYTRSMPQSPSQIGLN